MSWVQIPSPTLPKLTFQYRRCACPIWVQGTIGGKSIRKSLDLTSWEAATERIHEWEAAGRIVDPEQESITIEAAYGKFAEAIGARNVSPRTNHVHQRLGKKMVKFFEGRGITRLKDVNLDQLSDFQNSWTVGPLTATKDLERLRSFYAFAVKRKWVEDNLAKEIKKPIVEASETLPFTDEEWEDIKSAVLTKYPDNWGKTGGDNAKRLYAFVLTLRYTGLRLGDVATLRKSQVKDGQLLLRTRKNKTNVWMPIHPELAKALENVPGSNQTYFFWTGESDRDTVAKLWGRNLFSLFQLTEKTKNGHAHRFRDTFAVELLNADTPIEDVAILLGHNDVKTTQKHYSPWVASRQKKLSDHLNRVWKTGNGNGSDDKSNEPGTHLAQRKKPHGDRP